MLRDLQSRRIVVLFLAFLVLATSSTAAVDHKTIKGVRLENTRTAPATVTIRSSDGRVLAQTTLAGRASRYLTLEGNPRDIRVQVTRDGGSDAAGRLLADIMIAGAGRRESSGATHSHDGVTCNDPNCGSSGSSASPGSSSRTPRIEDAVGVLIAASSGGTTTTASGQVIDGVRITIDEELPSTVIDIADPPAEPAHHCQGGRLLVIVGDFANPTIQASLRWAETLQARDHHLHLLAYPTGGSNKDASWSIPHVPPPAGFVPTRASDIWPRYRSGDRNGNLPDLVATWRDCCYFEEVMFMFHGGQSGAFRGLIENLPKMLEGRPVRKFVLWSCESTDAFYPGRGGAGGERNYRNIAHLVRPRACPCACRAGVCSARGPRGERTTCPTADQPSVILASALVDGKAAKLGLAPGNAQPLTTPTGELRRITVAPTGEVTAEIMPEGTPVFAGLRSRADRELAAGSNTRVDVDRILQPVTAQAPRGTNPARDPNPYSGPRCCANGEGCIPNEAEAR